jgi:phage shock protein C
MNDIQRKFHDRGLVRPREGALIGGVCVGVGRRFGLTPWPTRALFVLSMILLPGSQILIYPVLWFLMPRESTSVHPTYGTPPMT